MKVIAGGMLTGLNYLLGLVAPHEGLLAFLIKSRIADPLLKLRSWAVTKSQFEV